MDGSAFGAEIVEIVKGYVDKAVNPLLARIVELEEQVKSIPAPVDLSGDLAALKSEVEAIVIPELPELELPDIPALVAEAVKAMPAPQDGKSITVDDVAPLIAAEVEKRVSELPLPKDGIGLAGALIDRSGELVVTLTNGEAKNLGPVVGKDVDHAAVTQTIEAKFEALPKARDGVDGLGFDDMEATFDGTKTVTLSFKQGERVKAFDFVLPIMVYRGVFKEGDKYTTGDTVTWGGSLWHCGEDTSDKPETTKAWTLAAKRGRDGKDGVVKDAGSAPVVRVGVQSKKDAN